MVITKKTANSKTSRSPELSSKINARLGNINSVDQKWMGLENKSIHICQNI